MASSAVSPETLLEELSKCVQTGKATVATDLPIGTRGLPGVVELVEKALKQRISAQEILDHGLLAGMRIIGRRFAANEIFIPNVLIAARAMKAGMEVLKPQFAETGMPRRGRFVIGTVRGDLHDIGKNLVAIVLEGAGWMIEDLGTDCGTEKFLHAIQRHPGCAVGLSALLTTTMVNMRETVAAIHGSNAETVVLVGGAPLTADFAKEIGANGYAADPAAAVALLDELVPSALVADRSSPGTAGRR